MWELASVSRITRNRPVSCEIERYEFALVPKMLGLPLVVLAHNEGTGKDEMDSLLKRYWWLHLLNQRQPFAARLSNTSTPPSARLTAILTVHDFLKMPQRTQSIALVP